MSRRHRYCRCGRKIVVQRHNGLCPNIKAIEYFEDGQIKRVEFKTPADYLAPLLPSPPLPIWPAPWPHQWPVTWGNIPSNSTIGGNTQATTGLT